MTTVKIAALLTMCLATVFLAASSLMADEAGPASSKGRIVYVAGDGSGDFNCDGKDDHVEINKAIEYVATHPDCSTVHLKGPNTYWISDTIYMRDNTILEGDSNAVLRVIDHKEAKWPAFKGMIECKGNGVQNIAIRGFEIHGNRATFSSDRHYYPFFLMNVYDVTINDMYIHDASGDGIKFGHNRYTFAPETSEWIKMRDEDLEHFNQLRERRGKRVNSRFYNNRIERIGHDGIYIISVDQFEVYSNHTYSCRTNSGIRLASCDEYSIHHNVMHNSPTAGFSGNAGVQIHNGSRPVEHVEIYENEISRMGLGGIVMWADRAPFGTQKNVHIHHNRIYDCNLAGIRIYGAHNTLIENNVLYGNRGDGIVHYFGYGPPRQGREAGEPPEGARYVTIVRNNVIANTLAGPGPDSVWGQHGWLAPVSGFGLNNYLSNIHAFVSEHNCIFSNVKGDYSNASSTTDIHVDPLFADPEKGDFHLLPDSPCRGAGTNGKDMGAYE